MLSTIRLAALAAAIPLLAQEGPAPVFTEVHPDRTVTFRFRAPNAKQVLLQCECVDRKPMVKDDEGVWTFTTPPLEPDFYGYLFVVDGVPLMETHNPLMKPNLLGSESMIRVPGSEPLPWEVRNVPHGAVHHHYYKSSVVGDERDFFVYTPPGYDATAKKTRYPVLYLLHGFSDDASGWTAVGRANYILDNLIAAGKAKPMLVVMPLGYGAPEVLDRTRRAPGLGDKNRTKFREALLAEVIPAVEKAYRVSTDRESRAIAGLSMGGAEALDTGLNSLDRFAWIGSFSAGGLASDWDKEFPALGEKANSELRLLWIACGTSDGLMDHNRKFREWLQSKKVQFTPIETSGGHAWLVWRRNLTEFAPLLFQGKK